jgi:glycosyltransferase involved in cell wall biosynthesis
VIVTRIAGIPELVTEDCGWVVAPGSADALADQMAEALTVRASRLEAMGEVGERRVRELHDINRNAQWLACLLEHKHHPDQQTLM